MSSEKPSLYNTFNNSGDIRPSLYNTFDKSCDIRTIIELINKY